MAIRGDSEGATARCVSGAVPYYAGGTMVWPEVRKWLKTSAFGAALSARRSRIHVIQIHESKPNGALSEVLPNRNSFGRADS